MEKLSVGSTFAEHVIRGVAGSAGWASSTVPGTYGLKREVALKVIAAAVSAGEDFRARFERELEAAASIDHHPNVIRYHAV
jgi:serine/threonine protein kinase